MAIKIESLNTERLKDFLYFFDSVAFTDNPGWANCYCYFYHIACGGKQWERRSKTDNRTAAEKLILSGKMKGYLAYQDGQPVGWCNANDKVNYPRLEADSELWHGKDEQVCSIVCFIVAPEHRGKGIADQLLHRALSDYSEKGYQ
ncbi:MAG: GNAT family N-acetyltransferase, partial [Spirochaetota bacterium]